MFIDKYKPFIKYITNKKVTIIIFCDDFNSLNKIEIKHVERVLDMIYEIDQYEETVIQKHLITKKDININDKKIILEISLKNHENRNNEFINIYIMHNKNIFYKNQYSLFLNNL